MLEAPKNLSTSFTHETPLGVTQTNERVEEVLGRKLEEILIFTIQNEYWIGGPDYSMEEFMEDVYDRFGPYDIVAMETVLETWKADEDIAFAIYQSIDPNLERELFSRFLRDAELALLRADVHLIPLVRLARDLEATTDHEIRKQKIVFLQEKLHQEMQSNSHIHIIEENSYPIKGDDCLWIHQKYNIQRALSNDIKVPANTIAIVAGALRKAIFETRIIDEIGTIDAKWLEQERATFGSKGAMLEVTKLVLPKIFHLLRMQSEDCVIDEYTRIPCELHKRWEKHEPIRNELQKYYQWISGRRMLVRSSARFSEDSEEITGAGIYDSVELPAQATFEEFVRIVEQIYQSVESERACEYRVSKGIEQEEMGIVLHEFIESSSAEKGYTNTTMPGVPQLMELVFEDGFRPIIENDVIEEQCGDWLDNSKSVFFYQPDYDECNKGARAPHTMQQLAHILFLLRLHFQHHLQCEFILEKVDFDTKIHLLQNRFLPKLFQTPNYPITFPDQEALFEGRAIGYIDMTLPILRNSDINCTKEGIIIFEGSYFASLSTKFSRRNLPKSGAIVVLGPAREGGGHIETLCVEYGLTLIFNPQYITHDEYRKLGPYGPPSCHARIDEFEGHDRLHVVANGLEGKLYPPGEDEGIISS